MLKRYRECAYTHAMSKTHTHIADRTVRAQDLRPNDVIAPTGATVMSVTPIGIGIRVSIEWWHADGYSYVNETGGLAPYAVTATAGNAVGGAS